MSNGKLPRTFAAIDVGSSKIAVCIARPLEDKVGVEVLGCAKHSSAGVERGVVVDIQQTINDMEAAIRTVEEDVPSLIESTVVNLNGSHISSMNVSGSASARKGRPISDHHVAQALGISAALTLDAGKQIVHLLPQQYHVDNQNGIVQPIGQAGRRLDADVHLITSSTNVEDNLKRCLTKCNLRDQIMIASPMASANAVLDQDIRMLGTCLIDIGHDTTSIAVFVDGLLKYTAVSEWGGRDVTWDIAKLLRTRPVYAQEMKEQATSSITNFQVEESVNVIGFDGHCDSEIRQSSLTTAIRNCYAELFQNIAKDLIDQDLFNEISHFMLTGGGAKMDGLYLFAEETFGHSAQVVKPEIQLSSEDDCNDQTGFVVVAQPADYQQLSDPSMSVVAGLLRREVLGRIKENSVPSLKQKGLVKTAARSVYRWLGGNV